MRSIGGLLFSDVKTRFLALVLAVLAWVSVYRESTETFPASIDLDVQKPPGVVILGVEDENGKPCATVEVKLSGPRGQRSELRALRLTKVIEAGQGGDVPDSLTFEVTEELLSLPHKFRLVEAVPRRIRVRMDQLSSAPMRLAPPREPAAGEAAERGFVEGKPAEGFQVKAVSIAPNYAVVQGPRSVVQKNSKVKVNPVKIDGLPAGVHQIPTAIAGTLDGHRVSASTSIVVTVEITEEPQEAAFPVKVSMVQTEDYARDFTAEAQVKEVELRVKGPASAINELKSRPELMMVVIDIAGMRPEECQPVDEKELIATRPLAVQFRGRFAGMDQLEVGFRKPEKPESLVTFRRRAKPEAPK